MSTAVDLVNAALLGTDRRPVPAPEGDDPAAWLLAGAGRRRALTLVAAGTATVTPSPAGPAARASHWRATPSAA